MGEALKAGDAAPEFELRRDDGKAVTLRDFAGKKLALYFYPKADTPGCTREAIAFSGLRDEFRKADTEVLGVSADEVEDQAAFKVKYELGIALGSDPSKAMLEAYGIIGEKTLYGRKSVGIIRTTYLIGRDGRVARTWRNVRVDGHAEAVLAAAKALE